MDIKIQIRENIKEDINNNINNNILWRNRCFMFSNWTSVISYLFSLGVGIICFLAGNYQSPTMSYIGCLVSVAIMILQKLTSYSHSKGVEYTQSTNIILKELGITEQLPVFTNNNNYTQENFSNPIIANVDKGIELTKNVVDNVKTAVNTTRNIVNDNITKVNNVKEEVVNNINSNIVETQKNIIQINKDAEQNIQETSNYVSELSKTMRDVSFAPPQTPIVRGVSINTTYQPRSVPRSSSQPISVSTALKVDSGDYGEGKKNNKSVSELLSEINKNINKSSVNK